MISIRCVVYMFMNVLHTCLYLLLYCVSIYLLSSSEFGTQSFLYKVCLVHLKLTEIAVAPFVLAILQKAVKNFGVQ